MDDHNDPQPLERLIGHLDEAGAPVRGGWWTHSHPHGEHAPDVPSHDPTFSHDHEHRWWPDPHQHHAVTDPDDPAPADDRPDPDLGAAHHP